MSDRSCEKCGKEFKYPSYLREHQRRKTPCAKIVARPTEKGKGVICEYCNRAYTTERSLSRHVKEACRIAPNARNGEEGLKVLYNHVKETQDTSAIVKRLEEGVEELRARLAAAGQQRAEVNAERIEGGVQITHNHIELNIFGGEDVSHLTQDRVRELLDEAQEGGRSEAIPEAAQEAVLKAATKNC